MAIEWHSSTQAGEGLAPNPGSLAWPPFRIRITLHDNGLLYRYVLHAALLILVLVVAWNVAPLDASRVPSFSLTMAQPSSSAMQGSSAGSQARSSDEGYLGAAVVPSTSLALRNVLPFSISQPRVRVRSGVTEYTVQAGDTVSQIAARFGLSESTLVWANPELDSDPDYLTIGQKMVIMPVDGVYHTVSQGESLESIAARYSVSVETILNYPGNEIDSSGIISVGQRLIIPGGVMPAPPKPVVVQAPQPAPQVQAPAAAAPAAPPASAPVGSGQFLWPIAGRISQYFGRGHLGIDLYAPLGAPVYAADDGYVSEVNYTGDGWWAGYGRWVVIQHGNGMQTLYAHLQSAAVQPGQTVAKGQQIGTCGSVGKSTGPHLHFEVLVGGSRVNPLSYLP